MCEFYRRLPCYSFIERRQVKIHRTTKAVAEAIAKLIMRLANLQELSILKHLMQHSGITSMAVVTKSDMLEGSRLQELVVG